ncbi:hypothetical protein HELRODRAFT_164950 [Helobdella robusta]|uniref:Endonuclease/exonuclease/phosphatase domain-containing protein n=1 Tax=Helobdella robusta TaxID=6412 RepID=T1EW03_HELRO|nr:hypothetical protein HELRODRAFT_164950 [Helobdella robusta]ESN92824.1 hypothetical protein HELRODRAFT_164950 [Helobdella robusta]
MQSPLDQIWSKSFDADWLENFRIIESRMLDIFWSYVFKAVASERPIAHGKIMCPSGLKFSSSIRPDAGYQKTSANNVNSSDQSYSNVEQNLLYDDESLKKGELQRGLSILNSEEPQSAPIQGLQSSTFDKNRQPGISLLDVQSASFLGMSKRLGPTLITGGCCQDGCSDVKTFPQIIPMPSKRKTTAPSSQQALSGQGVPRIPGKYAIVEGCCRQIQNGPSMVLRHGTLNVGSLTGRSMEIAEMLERRRINICCLEETRWKSNGVCHINLDNENINYSGMVERRPKMV